MSRRSTPHPGRKAKHLIEDLPDSPGVYLFFGSHGELLYVGKSKTIRTRVRSHFAAREECRMCGEVAGIEYRKTAGELGALLLESQLIKELKPLFNIRQRQKRRIMVARRAWTDRGYETVSLEAVDRIDPGDTDPILAIFKTRRQAADSLAVIAKAHRLCPKLLGLERTSRYCFSYHLHQCDGACMGHELPSLYNTRFERAFEERRIRAWPFKGAVIIEEHSAGSPEREVFVVDNWCLLYSFACADDKYRLVVRGLHRFDYDSYRILAGYIFDEENSARVRTATRDDIEALLQSARAA